MRGPTTNHAPSNYSAETMTILVLACAIRLEMVSNQTHRKRRNSKNNCTFSRIVRSGRE
jgi:hypothetical protein